MTFQRYELERPVTCRGCDALTWEVLLRVEANRVSDPLCPVCAQAGEPVRKRKLGRAALAMERKRKRLDEDTIRDERLT